MEVSEVLSHAVIGYSPFMGPFNVEQRQTSFHRFLALYFIEKENCG